MKKPRKTIALVASTAPEAKAALNSLKRRYKAVAPEDADVIVAIGGDGFMLETLHRYLELGTPIYGMNRGSIGFLMNEYRPGGLLERVAKAQLTPLCPLRMSAVTAMGTSHTALAINEVSLLRETRQAAKIEISVDGVVRLPELICDGILASTPAGSSAYNLSAHGPIIPLGTELLALTPISAFRPRRWRGALLPLSAHVRFRVLEADKRPVSAVADYTEVRDVVTVDVAADPEVEICLLFDPEHNLEERILSEQFAA
ncbi:MAG: NAD kinase [Alphaproteobacteria bacterium]